MFKQFILVAICAIYASAMQSQDYERYKQLSDTTFNSVSLGFEKNVSVTVPIEWQQGLNYSFPLIVIFDRQNRRSHDYILETIDYLTSNEQMPSSVILSVSSVQEHRYQETLHEESKDEGMARLNERFIFEELIPYAEDRLMANGFRLLIGHSRYGYYTTWLFASRIDDLNAVISLSPFFSQSNVELTDSIASLNGRPLDAMKYWRFGIGNDYPEDFHEMDSVVNSLDNAMIDAKGALFKDAVHNVTPGLTIAGALYDVFEYWAAQQEAIFAEDVQDMTTAAILESNVKDHYGNDLRFSLGTLNGKGWQFFNKQDYPNAIDAWTLMTECYPNFSEGWLFMAYARKELGQPFDNEVRAFKSSLKTSTVYSEDEKSELLDELKDLNEK